MGPFDPIRRRVNSTTRPDRGRLDLTPVLFVYFEDFKREGQGPFKYIKGTLQKCRMDSEDFQPHQASDTCRNKTESDDDDTDNEGDIDSEEADLSSLQDEKEKDEEVSDKQGEEESQEESKEEEETKSKGIIESFNEYLESIFSTYEEYDEEIEEELTAMYILLWRILSGTVGIIALIVIVIKYPQYLHILHENQLWFSNIKEVEREISFRTEQGLYYSYYKQILQAPSWSEGITELLHDNKTEHGRTINIIHRFNILPEIFLSALYKWVRPQDPPIIFYVASVFRLHGIFLAALFMTAWYLSSSCLAGVIASLLFIVHRVDATRVNYTIPLRESFAIPLLFLQILLICTYLRSNRYQKVKVSMIFILSLAFFLSWQFASFVSLCQLLAYVSLGRLHLLPANKVTALVVIVGASLLASCLIQVNPPLVISSPALSMLVPAFILSATPAPDKRLGPFVRIFVAAAEVALMLISTLLLNGFIKLFLNSDADSHVYQLLLSKLQMGDEKDFDSRIYMCHDAFRYMDLEALCRLSRSGLIPLYAVGMVVFMLSVAVDFFKKVPNDDLGEDDSLSWEERLDTDKKHLAPQDSDHCEDSSKIEDITELSKDSVDQFNKGYEVNDDVAVTVTRKSSATEVYSVQDIASNRPDLVLVLAFSIMWSILAGLILRLKVLWLPSVCVSSGVFLNDCRLFTYLFSKCGRLLSYLPRWFPGLIKVAVALGFVAHLANKYVGQISSDIWPEEVYEFWDPDTVELMEWIQQHTPPEAVFAGSMQLLASVLLCTGRPITNHPHYEDSWLRHQTHEIYQIYGHESAEFVHKTLRAAEVTYIILEDSICLESVDPKHPLCRTTDIVDLHNNHVPDDGSHGIAGLKQAQHGRFCDAIRHDNKEYHKFFSLVMSNKTFRVYRVAVT